MMLPSAMPLKPCSLRLYKENLDKDVSDVTGDIQATPMETNAGISPALQLQSISPPMLARDVQQLQAKL